MTVDKLHVDYRTQIPKLLNFGTQAKLIYVDDPNSRSKDQ